MLHCGSCSGRKSGAAQFLVKDPAQVEGDIDHVGEQLRPEECPGAPETEDGCPLRAFDGSQAAVIIGQARRGGVEQVGGILPERGEAMGRVAVEDKRAQGGHEEHLVGVPGHAVGAVESGDELPMPGAEAGRPTVGRIDVQPYAVAAADIGHIHQRIEGPHRRRACAGATATMG